MVYVAREFIPWLLAIVLNFSVLAGALASLITAGVIQLFKPRKHDRSAEKKVGVKPPNQD